MRISDWSSDVCSSDLGLLQDHGALRLHRAAPRAEGAPTVSPPGPGVRHDGDVVLPRSGNAHPLGREGRSEERRVGKESVSTCKSRWSAYHSKKNKTQSNLHHNAIHN